MTRADAAIPPPGSMQQANIKLEWKPEPNKVLAKLRFYLTTQMAHMNIADITRMAMTASSDGIEVELIKVQQGERMTVELEDLVTACLIAGVIAVPNDVPSIVWQVLA